MELHGVEATLVPLLKVGLLLVMLGGGVVVFRELVPMARGKPVKRAEPGEEQS
jgi:hypothetical protein